MPPGVTTDVAGILNRSVRHVAERPRARPGRIAVRPSHPDQLHGFYPEMTFQLAKTREERRRGSRLPLGQQTKGGARRSQGRTKGRNAGTVDVHARKKALLRRQIVHGEFRYLHTQRPRGGPGPASRRKMPAVCGIPDGTFAGRYDWITAKRTVIAVRKQPDEPVMPDKARPSVGTRLVRSLYSETGFQKKM